MGHPGVGLMDYITQNVPQRRFEMTDLKKAIKTIAKLNEQENSEQIPDKSRLMLTQYFNLQGINPKIEVMENTPLCTGWMAFVNNKYTLAHIMHQDDHESYVRVKLSSGLKGATEEYVRKVLYNRMKAHYIF